MKTQIKKEQFLMPKPSVSQMETWQFLLSWSFLSVLQHAVSPPVRKFLLLVTLTNVTRKKKKGQINKSNPVQEPCSGPVLLWFHSDILIESKPLLQ